MSRTEKTYSAEEVKAETEKAVNEATGNTMWGCFVVVLLIVGGVWFAWTQAWKFGFGTGTWDDIYEEKKTAVVKVIAIDSRGSEIAFGSGFFVTKDGMIATNHHVVKDARRLAISMFGREEKVKVRLLESDEKSDVALLKFDATQEMKCFDLDEALPKIGSEIAAIGHPLGLTNTLSKGEVSGHRDIKNGEMIDGSSWVQITAPISPGSSGGPVFTDRGRVIGMATLYAYKGQNLNFATAASSIRRLMDKVTRPPQEEPKVEPAPSKQPTLPLPPVTPKPTQPFKVPGGDTQKWPLLEPKPEWPKRWQSPYAPRDPRERFVR